MTSEGKRSIEGAPACADSNVAFDIHSDIIRSARDHQLGISDKVTACINIHIQSLLVHIHVHVVPEQQILKVM